MNYDVVYWESPFDGDPNMVVEAAEHFDARNASSVWTV